MKIAIDPGHGLSNKKAKVYDPGAISGGVAEAEIVWQWAQTGKFLLTQAGFSVFLTRDATSEAPVGTRDDRAKAAGSDRFISLHCNAATGRATGVETFYRGSEDKAWAQMAQDAAVAALDLRSRGLKTEGQSQHSRLAVLDFPGPACLVELGFIDNPTDRARMLERDRRIAFWTALIAAIRST